VKAFFKKYLVDIFALLLLALLSLGSFGLVALYSKRPSSIASISRSGTILMEIDLDQENEERIFVIEGKKTPMSIGVKHQAIRVVESGCPTQFCVHEGYISGAGHPLVCAYNEVIITLSGDTKFDVEAK